MPVAHLLLGAGGATPTPGPYKAKSSAADHAGRDRGSDAGTDVCAACGAPSASEEQKAKSSVHVDVDLHLD